MKIILSKDDIEGIIKKYYDMEALAWNDDGTITMDTTLERIMNEKNDMKTLDEKLRSQNATYLSSPYSVSESLINTSQITNPKRKWLQW